MSDSFSALAGRQVVSKQTAEALGGVTHILPDAKQHEVSSLIVGKGRNALVLDCADVDALGPDAVMVTDAGALRAPQDDRESATADGRLELIGKRALDGAGNDIGEVADVRFDPDTRAIESLRAGGLRGGLPSVHDVATTPALSATQASDGPGTSGVPAEVATSPV